MRPSVSRGIFSPSLLALRPLMPCSCTTSTLLAYLDASASSASSCACSALSCGAPMAAGYPRGA